MSPQPPPLGAGIHLYRQLGGACESLPTVEVLLQNVSAQPAAIDEITTTDPRFTAMASWVPGTLQAGARAAIQVGFSADSPGEFDADLRVHYDAGCVTFPMKGVAVLASEDAIVGVSTLALDFGAQRTGTTTEKVVRFLVQPTTAAGRGPIQIGDFTTNPDSFQVLAPPSSMMLGACTQIDLGIRFLAPGDAQSIKGFLGWNMSSQVGDKMLDAASRLDVFADAIK
jgi:hypothetical protein